MYKHISEISVKEHTLSNYFDDITHNTWVSFGKVDTHFTLEIRYDKKHRLKEGRYDIGYIEKVGDKVMFRPNGISTANYDEKMFYGDFDVSEDLVFLVCVKHENNMSILKVGDSLFENNRSIQVNNVMVYPTEEGDDYVCDLVVPLTNFNFTGYAKSSSGSSRSRLQLKI